MINKKLKILALIGALALLFGCSSEEKVLDKKPQVESEKTVEKAEVEKMEEEILDIRDMDKLYKYFNENIFESSRDEFGGIISVEYLDVSGDGAEEAIILNDKTWDQPINIITIDKNQYKVLSNKISKAKYLNEFFLKDGFVVLNQKTGGSGMADKYMSLYKYADGQLIQVLEHLYLEGHVSIPPDVAENFVSTLDGNYIDFEYLLVKEDNINNTREVMESKHYTYNDDNFSFTVKDTKAPEISTTIEEDLPENSGEFVAGNLLSDYGVIQYGNEEIDLNKYVAVALPMYSGEYSDRLKRVEYNIGNNNDKTVTLSMFGKYENVQIEYYANNEAEKVVTEIGDLENVALVVNGDFDVDEAYIRILCDVNGSDDRWSSAFNISPFYDEFSNMQFMIE